MKRILILLFIFHITLINAQVRCNQGDQNPQAVPDSIKDKVAESISVRNASYDPNEIIGPEGYDSVRWVSVNDVLRYTILFENDPDFATAAAQRVDVRFNFPNKAWMKGFGIGNYSFANMSWVVANPSNAYQERIDLKESHGYYVDLIGGLDVVRQQGFWLFSTIDPETGYAPWESEVGMLPVNDETHVGEGAVTFQLMPYEGLQTGDTISIQASIVFDQNDTIPTNRWCNKIDAGMPESKVTAEVHPTRPDVYNLKFSGKDDKDGSGLRHILLYLVNHNGIYEEIDTVTVDTVLAFPVEAGKQYKLYSIAVDNTGNREPAKTEPDVILNFNQAPTDIVLSDSTFQDDLMAGGFIGQLTSIDDDDDKNFTYALAEGDGAIHNDLFQIEGDQLQIKNNFKCAEETTYKVRISTTDEGGMSYSKAFILKLDHVLERPEPKITEVTICEGDCIEFYGEEYDQNGTYTYSQGNEYACDSVFVLKLTVLPILDPPLVTVENTHTLVSSAAKGNQWFRENGTPVEGATEQRFTPEEDGVYFVAVSNGACFSPPSQFYRIELSDRINLQMDLSEGWNWISSNLSNGKYTSSKGYLLPIIDAVDVMVGSENELTVEDGNTVGTLKTMDPQESYKLKLFNDVTGKWSGNAYHPEETTLSLKKGWNWIGYVPVSEHPLAEALSNLSPSENDVIKGLDEFAIYSGGLWHGTMSQMRPGVGYMYFASNDREFTYPVTRVFAVDNSANMRKVDGEDYAPWSYDKHEYMDNQTIVAELYMDGSKTVDGVYTVGAFVGEECRGIGTYIDGLIYLTVHGTIGDNETISFKAYGNVTMLEYTIDETLTLNGVHTGTFANPYKLHTKKATDIGEVSVSLNIYPNPVRNIMYIDCSSQIEEVKILTSNGRIVFSTEHYSNDGINVASLAGGVYIVAIKTASGYCYRKVVKVN